MGCSFLATPSWAANWTTIDGSGQRWWIDLDSISVDNKQGVSFFTEQMGDAAGVQPDVTETQYGIAAVHEAIDCSTGELFSYDVDDNDEGHWSKDTNKWPPEYFASVRRIVCRN
jgi:hypothetical protein